MQEVIQLDKSRYTWIFIVRIFMASTLHILLKEDSNPVAFDANPNRNEEEDKEKNTINNRKKSVKYIGSPQGLHGILILGDQPVAPNTWLLGMKILSG